LPLGDSDYGAIDDTEDVRYAVLGREARHSTDIKRIDIDMVTVEVMVKYQERRSQEVEVVAVATVVSHCGSGAHREQ
jgi:hypothetical protein